MINSFIRDKILTRKKESLIVLGSILAGVLLISYAISIFAFISPSRDLRWETSVVSLDKTSYTAGEPVVMNILLEEGTEFLEDGGYFDFVSPEDIIWTISVFDPDNAPIYVHSTQMSDAMGDVSQNDVSSTLPDDASPGTYKIRVTVWTELLPSGETRTLLINERTFEVTP